MSHKGILSAYRFRLPIGRRRRFKALACRRGKPLAFDSGLAGLHADAGYRDGMPPWAALCSFWS